MAWVFLILGGCLDIVCISGLKYATETKRPLIIIPLVGIILLSFYLMSLAMRTIPMGTAYAVWVGIAVLGTALSGIIFYHESTQPLRVFFILLLIVSVIGLKLTSTEIP